MKQILMQKLYENHFLHWNKRLEAISTKNARCYNRPDFAYTIFYRNKKWQPIAMNWFADPNSALCLPVHPDFPEIEAEMKLIAEDFDDIHNERYEVDRFLSGLFLFKAPPEVFKEALGHTLYSLCDVEMESHAVQNELFWSTDDHSGLDDIEWNGNTEDSLKVYLEDKGHIIKAMNERLLMNLITTS